jgi:hypothetical protein
MLDYIEITKHLQGKDKPFLGHLQKEAVYTSGMERYFVKGCRKMEINYNSNNQTLKLKGSPLYFNQGHNFTYDKENYIRSIQYISDLINVELFDSDLDIFESGVIFNVEAKPKVLISGHLPDSSLKMRENTKDKGGIRYFYDQILELKLYDAGKNIQHKQGLTMKEIIKQSGWNPEGYYLKFEAHYKKPHLYFNNGRALSLAEIFLPKWENILKEDLYIQYQRLKPMKAIEIPNKKNELSSGLIILIELAETMQDKGKGEIKKILFDRINSIPEEVLSLEDRKARKRQINTMLGKIGEASTSKYDLTELLCAALNIQEGQE